MYTNMAAMTSCQNELLGCAGYRVDARFGDHEGKKVWVVEMICSWVENPGKKDEEKTGEQGPLR